MLYGCEAWSLKLREEHRLRVFENRTLRQIFGPKRDVNSEWRRFHNHVTRKEEGRSVIKIVTGILAGKRPSGRPRSR